MIILGIPNNMEDYFMADGELAWELEKAGFHAKYMDESMLYFKLNKKLIKKLSDLDIEV